MVKRIERGVEDLKNQRVFMKKATRIMPDIRRFCGFNRGDEEKMIEVEDDLDEMTLTEVGRDTTS